jgi:endoglucanase
MRGGFAAAALVLVAGCASQAPAARVSPAPPPSVSPIAGQAGLGIRVEGNHFVDAAGKPVRLLGVNFAGGEAACVLVGFQEGASAGRPGPVFDYQGAAAPAAPGRAALPPDTFIAAMAAFHANAVRFMVNEMCWLGRPGPGRPVPPSAPIPQAHYDAREYRKGIVDFVAGLHRHNLYAVIVLGDNPCPYRFPDQDGAPSFQPPGSQYSPCADNQQVMPDADNAPAFWASLASTFRDDHGVVFELFNEPHMNLHEPAPEDPWLCWKAGCKVPGESWRTAGMQDLVRAVRSAGATQPILLEGLSYGGRLGSLATADQPATGWLDPGVRVADTITPPQLGLANHLYPETWDASDPGCAAGDTAPCWRTNLSPFAAGMPLVTTEVGEHDCDRGSSFIDAYTRWADEAETTPQGTRAPVSYLGWTFNGDYSCNEGNTSLVTDWNGTPNAAGKALSAHLGRVR